ncbi:MAG: 6-carboxytetrahydropterin synthase [Candidatus Hydrothermales bacterium]
MPWILRKRVKREIGHMLFNYEGKCAYPHGHTYWIEVEIQFDELDERGMGKDFEEIEFIIKEVFPDHVFFKHRDDKRFEEKEGVISLPFNPTAENLSKWTFEKFKERGLKVKSVKIEETPFSHAIYFE